MISSSVFMRKINYPIVSNHYRTAVSDTGVCSCTWAPGCEVATSSQHSSFLHYVAQTPQFWCTLLRWAPRFGLHFIWSLNKQILMELPLSLASPHTPADTSSYSQSFCCWQCRRFHARQLQLLVLRVSSTASCLCHQLSQLAGINLFCSFRSLQSAWDFLPHKSLLPPVTLVTFTWNNLYC